MKKFLVLLSLIISIKSYADTEEKNCFILSSPPDYEHMNLISVDSIWQDIPTVRGKDFKYTSFRDAYKIFYNNVVKSIKGTCEESNIDGVVNLTINHSVGDKWHYFSATYDLWRFKK